MSASPWIALTSKSRNELCPTWVNVRKAELTGMVYVPSLRELYLEGSSNNYTVAGLSEEEARTLVASIIAATDQS